MSNADSDAEETVRVRVRRINSVSAHNARVRRSIASSIIPFARRAVLYEMNSTRPRMILVPPNDDWDPARGTHAGTDDLDVRALFGRHFVIEQLRNFPGTECYMTNGFDIIASANMSSNAERWNLATRNLFGIGWIGNLLVVKRGRRDRTRTVNITQSEMSLINVLVQCWLELNTEKA